MNDNRDIHGVAHSRSGVSPTPDADKAEGLLERLEGAVRRLEGGSPAGSDEKVVREVRDALERIAKPKPEAGGGEAARLRDEAVSQRDEAVLKSREEEGRRRAAEATAVRLRSDLDAARRERDDLERELRRAEDRAARAADEAERRLERLEERTREEVSEGTSPPPPWPRSFWFSNHTVPVRQARRLADRADKAERERDGASRDADRLKSKIEAKDREILTLTAAVAATPPPPPTTVALAPPPPLAASDDAVAFEKARVLRAGLDHARARQASLAAELEAAMSSLRSVTSERDELRATCELRVAEALRGLREAGGGVEARVRERDSERSRADAERARADKEAGRADEERGKREREKDRADGEAGRADKEKDRADKETERADKEKDRADKERDRADREAGRADKEKDRADKEAADRVVRETAEPGVSVGVGTDVTDGADNDADDDEEKTLPLPAPTLQSLLSEINRLQVSLASASAATASSDRALALSQGRLHASLMVHGGGPQADYAATISGLQTELKKACAEAAAAQEGWRGAEER